MKFVHDAYDHQRRQSIMNRLPMHGTVLDVGCGDGFITDMMPTLDLEVTGIDPEPTEDRFRRCKLEDFSAAAKSFDYVTAFEVLEHVPNPAAIVAKMSLLARKAVYVSVPVGKEVYHPTHKNFFQKADLEKLMPGCKVSHLDPSRSDGRPMWFWVVWDA